MDVTQLSTVAALTDGDRDTDAQSTCDFFVSWQMNSDAVHRGTFVLDFNDPPDSLSYSYMIAHSSDGQNWKQMGTCQTRWRTSCNPTHAAYVSSPRGGCMLTKGFEVTAPDEKLHMETTTHFETQKRHNCLVRKSLNFNFRRVTRNSNSVCRFKFMGISTPRNNNPPIINLREITFRLGKSLRVRSVPSLPPS